MKLCATGTISKPLKKTLTISIEPDVLKLFAEKMTEKKETNKSELIEYLMQCWVYSCDGECDQKCPFMEPKNDAKKD
jgi:hypothetical protein